MSVEIIKVPDIGGAQGVEVIEICVAVGDQVAEEDSLVVLESDKASMEVPSPVAGAVTAIRISEGDALSEGDAILELETRSDNTAVVEPASEPAPAQQAVSEADDEPAPAAQPSPVTTSTTVEQINTPELGGAEKVDVIEVCVCAGDQVAEGDSLLVLETDKASMEVPAPSAGMVLSVSVNEGDQISEGDEILQLQVSAVMDPAATASAAAASAELAPVATTSEQSATPVSAPAPAPAKPKAAAAIAPSTQSSVYAGPAVRKLAREMGVEIAAVKGSGPRGRISKDDLKAHIKTALTDQQSSSRAAAIAPVPAVDFSRFGEVEVEPLSKIHKLTAANMQRSWLNVPHVTQFDDADITELESFRQTLKAEAEQRGVKITPLPFLLKACALALKAHPKFNASLHADGEHLVYKQYVHIGMAVDTPAGLVVPVLRDVDKKSIWQLAAETVEMADKAKSRKLKPDEMQGGCFTLSSLGGIGGQGFTPIVNAPEVAILGISKLAVKPFWNGSEFVPRKMLPLSLSYDHRAINGGDAGRFFTYLAQLLSDIRRLAL